MQGVYYYSPQVSRVHHNQTTACSFKLIGSKLIHQIINEISLGFNSHDVYLLISRLEHNIIQPVTLSMRPLDLHR